MADSFQLKALITGVDQLSPKLKSIRGNVARFSKQLKSSGLGEFSFAGLAASVAPLLGAAKAAIDFESAMADVKKVVDFDTPQQFKAMGQDVLALSKRLPMAAKDIAAIVAAGGQAGLGKDNQAELGSEAQRNDYVKLYIIVPLSLRPLAEALYKNGTIPVKKIAEQLDISKTTLYLYLRSRNVRIG